MEELESRYETDGRMEGAKKHQRDNVEDEEKKTEAENLTGMSIKELTKLERERRFEKGQEQEKETEKFKFVTQGKEEDWGDHPAVQAIDAMIVSYGGQWPPRPSFTDWPPAWNAYVTIADDMCQRCHELNDAALFREWMRQQLDEKVDLSAVMAEVGARMSTDDPVFLGFLAPLSYMVNLYRWGCIPTTDEERLRQTLDFPDKLWKPFTEVSDFWGLVHRSNTFGMNVCNCLYDNKNDRDHPTDMRFCFNYLPEIVPTEKNFFMSFLHMENTFRPALMAMREFLIETEQAKQSLSHAEESLKHRIELLSDIRKVVVKVSRLFSMYMKDSMVSLTKWADYVQGLPAWNINGVDGGASGGESLTFHALDEFLGTYGEGTIYTGGMSKREGIPREYIRVLDMLREHGQEYRFTSFLGHDLHDDPVLKAKDDLIQMLYTWRLGHSKIAPRYLLPSRLTSGGSVDKVIITGDTLSTRGGSELLLRARETITYLQTRAPPKSSTVNPVDNSIRKETEEKKEVQKADSNPSSSYLGWLVKMLKYPIDLLYK